MMNAKKKLLLGLSVVSLLTACEKGSLIGEGGSMDETLVRVTAGLPVTSRALTQDLAAVVPRLGWTVFDATTGARVKNTESTEASIEGPDYGKLEFRVSPGTYLLLIVAHAGLGNATLGSPEKVTFKSSKVTDTFWILDTLKVLAGGGVIERPLVLSRATVKVRIEAPVTGTAGTGGTSSLRFYYTGGSSTFNPRTGTGCVQSRQTETREVSGDGVYEVYTFPYQSTEGSLKMTVTLLGDAGEELDETTLPSGIPVRRGAITEVRLGSLYDKTGVTGGVWIDPTWDSMGSVVIP